MAHSGMADLDRLEKWSNEIAELSQRNITSRLVEECIAAYKDAMKYLSQNVELPLRTFRQLETSCSSFILWDNGYGVATGHIDEALMTSQRLQRIILEHLISICETLSTRLPALNPLLSYISVLIVEQVSCHFSMTRIGLAASATCSTLWLMKQRQDNGKKGLKTPPRGPNTASNLLPPLCPSIGMISLKTWLPMSSV
jgi:hypothetical protein